ncbi:SLC13 family permease [Cytophagaceae bacterium DM2B3-1]|uniref:SLC13 family permease n=1 Tax=Xanthocytophaga flava TaxID=3048013 RepID=A0ABT7CG62_9BACT|nr:SLC13 family permease [Xanthocytophaga flavus]MDJ1473579.1 SLC13 family permease [Xanthocytophaga flavus]MDJ1492736.1 SLC13 family permease [Xanthocytophaga flavus]
MEIALVLILLVVAIILFATEKLSVDVVTILLLIVLILSGILSPEEAFVGFSSDFIIILASIFVVSGALQETGVLDRIGSSLVKISSKATAGMVATLVMFIAGSVSAFMNNTTVTAIFVGPVIGVAKKLRISPSKLLMPLAFSSILGGTCTLIGTSTNVAVSGYLEKNNLTSIGMFEITPIGIILFLTGIAFMFLVGNKMLPDYKDSTYMEEYSMREYLSEVVVTPGSALAGQRIFNTELSRMDIRILKILRANQVYFPHPDLVIQENDLLLVEAKLDDLIRIKETNGIEIRGDMLSNASLESPEIQLAEVLVTRTDSDLIGNNIKNANFRQRFGLVVIAIHRYGETLREKIHNIDLKLGDLLLVQGTPERLAYLRENHDLTVMGEFKPLLFKQKRGILVVALFVLAVLVGSLTNIPLSVCFLTAAVGSVLTKAISSQKAYEIIDWRLLILIGGMSAFGMAMQKTGASEWLANLIVDWFKPFGNVAILAGFVILTVLLTQPMSNAAAALVILPIALQTATSLQVSPRTFAIGVMLAASVSLVTPFEPSCILVYAPGKYKFADFFKIGSLLTCILVVIIVVLVPYLWPF